MGKGENDVNWNQILQMNSSSSSNNSGNNNVNGPQFGTKSVNDSAIPSFGTETLTFSQKNGQKPKILNENVRVSPRKQDGN